MDLAGVNLSPDFPRTPHTGHREGHHTFLLEVPADAARLLAAFQALLFRYTQQEGYLLALGALEAHDAPVRARARDLAVELSAETPSELLLARAAAALTELPDSVRPSLLPVAITLVRAAGAATGSGPDGDRLARLEALAGQLAARPDLHLVAFPTEGPPGAGAGGGPTPLVLIYNAALFQAATIAALAGHLQVLVGALATAPAGGGRARAGTIAALPMLTAAERALLDGSLTSPWSSGEDPYPALPVHRLFEQQAAADPAAVAVTFRERPTSYGEINRRANQLARHLLAGGLPAGGRVAVAVAPSPDILVAILGIWKAGGVHVPLDPSYPMDRLAVILEDTAPHAVIAQGPLLARLPRQPAPVIRLDEDRGTLEEHPGEDLDRPLDLQQTAYVIYTSGTTGKPKGVMISQANLIYYVLSAQRRYGFTRADVMPAFARFSFSITFFELLSTLVVGGRLVILEREEVLDFPRLVRTLAQVTFVHASPSLLRKLVAYIHQQAIPPSTFDNLRHLSSGGDLVAPDLQEAWKSTFRRAELFVIYGCSEVSCMGCTYPIPRDQVVKRSFVGRPFPNVSVRLTDPQGNLVPVGVPGEICFGGAGLAQGYLGRPELTAEKFVEQDGRRYYRTGDLGRYDHDGNIEILGRSDFQIKLRGFRIELGEIETTLRRAPGVREGLVVARDLPGRGEPEGQGEGGGKGGGGAGASLVAYVVAETGARLDLREVRRFLSTKLPDYMVPAAFVQLDGLPVNMNQKVDRRALPAPTARDLVGGSGQTPARTPVERRLVDIWERLLGIAPIGVRDSFFEVGGNSLLSLPLMVEIEKAFGVTLPMSTLLTEPTIEQLALLLEPDDRERPSVVLLREGGGEPPLFLVHDGEGESLPYRTLAQRLGRERRVYAVHPRSRTGQPILQTRIGEIADFYAAEVRRVQPQGPYLLGGLCIGGFLAFEVARRLEAAGERVALVALIDAAHVLARPRGLLATKVGRFVNALRRSQHPAGPAVRPPATNDRGAGSSEAAPPAVPGLAIGDRLSALLRTATRKISSVISWEVKSRSIRLRNQGKVRVLRFCLERGLPLPALVKGLPVRTVLRFAEREYVAPAPYRGRVVLFRATARDPVFDGTIIDDTPYRELFASPLLGWEGRVLPATPVRDMPGGHSSMLQDPNVELLARELQGFIDAGLAAFTPRGAAAPARSTAPFAQTRVDVEVEVDADVGGEPSGGLRSSAG